MARSQKKYPSEMTPKGKVYFFLLKNIFCRLVWWLWVKKVRGTENIPSKGPFLVVCNHRTYIDFMFLTFAFRKIRVLLGFIKDSYFDVPYLNFFLRDLAQIRVDWNDKKASIRKATMFLEECQVVVLFPEGTRTGDGKLGKFYNGAGLLVQKEAGLLVVPVNISGTIHRAALRPFLRRGATVNIGKPVVFPRKLTSEEITELIRGEVERLQL